MTQDRWATSHGCCLGLHTVCVGGGRENSMLFFPVDLVSVCKGGSGGDDIFTFTSAT